MGRCPVGASDGSLFGGGQKKGLQKEIQNDIVQEIEALLGRQAIHDLDFEAVEMAARRQALRLAARALEQRLNADTSDHVGPEAPYHAPAEDRPSIMAATTRRLKAYWVRCIWSGPTITVLHAKADSAHAIGLCDWRCFRSHLECCA